MVKPSEKLPMACLISLSISEVNMVSIMGESV